MESALTSPVVKSFLAGSLSGTCSTLLFQPLDLVKTRVQSSISTSNGARPVGMVAVVANVVQQEKVVGLWRGLVPSMSRCVPGIGIYFSTIHYLKGKFQPKSSAETMVVGGTARSVAVVTMLPFTVLKTRYESGEYVYRSMMGSLVSIYHSEGMKGLFSGITATLLRDVPFSGLYFMFYSKLKECKLDIPDSSLPLFHFTCGVTAGMMASMVTQPADVVKTHMQLYPKKYRKIRNAVIYVYQRDGIEGFWRGIVPRTIRRTLMAALAWTVYEEVSKSCGLK